MHRRRDDARGGHARHDGRLTRVEHATQTTEQPSLKVNLHQLLKTMVEKGASDMHITTGSPPLLRIDGSIVPLKLPPLGAGRDQAALLLGPHRGAEARSSRSTNELDLSFGVKGLSRFRANIFMQRGAVAGAFRTIPFKILTFEELGLPPIVAELAKQAARPGARHRPDRLGQVDDARGDHRQDQHRAAPAHHHDRGPDRVPAPAQELRREPARGRAPTPRASRTRSSTSSGRTRTSCSSARCATSRRSRRR